MLTTEARARGRESSFLVAQPLRLPDVDEPFLLLHREYEKKRKNGGNLFPINLGGNQPIIEGYHLVYKNDMETKQRQFPIFVSREIAKSPAEARKIISSISNTILNSFFLINDKGFKPTKKKRAARAEATALASSIKLERREAISINMFNREIRAELKHSLLEYRGFKIWTVTLCPRAN